MGNRTKRKKSLNKMPSLSIRNHVLQELRADRARSVAEFERADARRPRSKYREEHLCGHTPTGGRIAELSGLPVDNWQFSERHNPRMRPAHPETERLPEMGARSFLAGLLLHGGSK